MAKTHNKWLHWKIKRGLAPRGRSSGALAPKGLIAKVLYALYYKRYSKRKDVR